MIHYFLIKAQALSKQFIESKSFLIKAACCEKFLKFVGKIINFESTLISLGLLSRMISSVIRSNDDALLSL